MSSTLVRILTLGAVALIFLFKGVVAWTTNNSAAALPSTSNLPVTLKTDAWQLSPFFVVLLFVLGGVIFTDYTVFRMHERLPHSATGFQIIVMGPLVTLAVAYLFGSTLLKMISPDRVIFNRDTIQISSLGRTREWDWRTISNAEVKNQGRGGTARFQVPGGKIVFLPKFLRSSEGPVGPDAVCELMNQLISKSKPASSAFQPAAV